MPVPSQVHCGFPSFPVVDWFCLFVDLWVLPFPWKIALCSVILLLPLSALISYNFTIKNYVNRKITSYLLIFTKSLWLHVKHFIALTKRESGRRIFFGITDQDYTCQHIDQWQRKTRESTTALAIKKKKKTCVRIKRVKSDSYLTYGQSCNTYMELYVTWDGNIKKTN